MNLEEKIKQLRPLVAQLLQSASIDEKMEILFSYAHQQIKNYQHWLLKLNGEEKLAAYVLIVIGQAEQIGDQSAFKSVVETLIPLNRFYDSIGGITGYYLKALELMVTLPHDGKKTYQLPVLFDITEKNQAVKHSVACGIEALPNLGELYPVGGLGDRLNLRGKQGEPLPTAVLPFCGRSLLEGLLRDVRAREYLYYKLFGKQVFVPIALMTSHEKENHSHILEICEACKWFGRPKELFFLFPQLSVPVMTKEGAFSMRSPHQLNVQPGGHGAIWRTAEEKGVFKWFLDQGKENVLIRQINNPIAGLDDGLLALIGYGVENRKTFGFASCKRAPNAAEGVLVVVEKEKQKSVVNLEYTDFQRLGIEGMEEFPTNTNILFAHLPTILPHIAKNPLPGITLNMKSDKGGRLESMMQSISETLSEEETFVIFNERLKTISVTKKSYEEGKSLLETPLGAFYDLMHNAHRLLTQECGVEIPPFSSPEKYLQEGPSLLFLYNPALGPLYEIIRQKIVGGRMALGAELQLETGELFLKDLFLDGSLFITGFGTCYMDHVQVKNKGMKKGDHNLYWKNEHGHFERLRITLGVNSEFFAENVVVEGDLEYNVPSNERWSLTSEGLIKEKIDAPSWTWEYSLMNDEIKLSRKSLLNLNI